MPRHLSREGVRKGDRVAIYMQNCPQYSICQIGAHKAGAIVVPCGPMFKAWELEEEIAQTGTRTIVCQDELFPNVEEADARCKFDRIIVTGFADFLPEAPSYRIHETMKAPKVHFPHTIELLDIVRQEFGRLSPRMLPLMMVACCSSPAGQQAFPKGRC